MTEERSQYGTGHFDATAEDTPHVAKYRQRIAGIPPRFQGHSVADYPAADGRQAQTKQVLAAYVEHFSRARELGTSLVFCGRVGTGKTRLACSVANDILDQGYSVIFAKWIRTLSRFRESYRPAKEQRGERTETRSSIVKELTAPDLLVLDEIGVQHATADELTLAYEILDHRYDAMRPSIVVGNLAYDDLAAYLGERVVDRLSEGAGAVLAFDWESMR